MLTSVFTGLFENSVSLKYTVPVLNSLSQFVHFYRFLTKQLTPQYLVYKVSYKVSSQLHSEFISLLYFFSIILLFLYS